MRAAEMPPATWTGPRSEIVRLLERSRGGRLTWDRLEAATRMGRGRVGRYVGELALAGVVACDLRDVWLVKEPERERSTMQEPFQSLLVWIVIIAVLVVAALVLHSHGVF